MSAPTNMGVNRPHGTNERGGLHKRHKHLPRPPGLQQFVGGENVIWLPPKIGRNHPCPCGSGKKFKRCHL
jgi:uncharacterized protein YecA (UPF0149 family)